jgi:hypothetical protein
VLVACFALLVVGVSLAATSKSGGLVFWAGILIAIGGIAGALTLFFGQRRGFTARREN